MRTCAFGGCERPAIKRAWCNAHYERMRLAGQIVIDRERDPEVRFWRKVDKTGDCWIWTAALNGPDKAHGYGQAYFRGKVRGAHRIAYELTVGPIPEGMHLDHLCRNPRCVNPAHLEPVPPRTNILRGMSPAAIHATANTCVNGHEFTEENTRRNAKGGRACRACDRAAYHAKKLTKVKPIKNGECLVCGGSFAYVGHLQQICSDVCRVERQRQHNQASQARRQVAAIPSEAPKVIVPLPEIV